MPSWDGRGARTSVPMVTDALKTESLAIF